MKKIFRKEKERERINKFALVASDIENDPVTGAFQCAAVYGYTKDHHGKLHKVERYFDNKEDYLKNLKRLQGCKLVYFNMSYDYLFIQDICDDSKLLTANGRYISGEIKDTRVKIFDIMNHATDGTLEDWILHLKMLETHGLKKETLDDKKVRVESDTKATYVLADYIQAFYVSTLGIPLTLTIASAARRFFAQYYFKDFWTRDNDEIDLLERQSYKGGRAEAFQKTAKEVWSYDVNSMYLSIMRDEELPDPNSAKLYRKATELPEKGLYIASCKVDIPKQQIAPLPYTSKKLGKLVFPTGIISGVWCSPELDYAVKECGVKILSIEWVITYKSKPYFRHFANYIWKTRQDFPKSENAGMNLLVKKIGNSLYGSFGQRNNLLDFAGKEEDSHNIDIQEGDRVTRSIINGVEHILIASSDKEDSTHTFPCIPSIITSFSRLKLLKKMKKHERYVLYCDTDSVKLTIDLGADEHKTELGAWGFEPKNSGAGDWVFHKPKYYSRNSKGKPDKLKGVPSRGVLLEETAEYQIFKYQKPNKYKESVRRGLTPNQWRDVIKKVMKTDDKRVWHGNNSIPLSIGGDTDE